MKYRVKVKFNFFNQGDIVGDADYNKYGAQYFEPVSEKPIDSANTADIPAPPHDKVMSSADIMTKAKAEEEAKAKAEEEAKAKAEEEAKAKAEEEAKAKAEEEAKAKAEAKSKTKAPK